MTLATLKTFAALKDGPVKKFQLIKTFGALLREETREDFREWSCARLVMEIAKLVEN
jgi:hypothetical protein